MTTITSTVITTIVIIIDIITRPNIIRVASQLMLKVDSLLLEVTQQPLRSMSL